MTPSLVLVTGPEELLAERAVASMQQTAQLTTVVKVDVTKVAAYRSADDAERQKAALALLGEEAVIEKVTIDGRETFYRVRLGPVKGLNAAQALSQSVNRNGFDSMVVKVQ